MKKILLIGEPMLDVSEELVGVDHVRTVARHKQSPYRIKSYAKPVLGGVFFIGRFLEQFSNVDILYPNPTAIKDRSYFSSLTKELSEQGNYTLYPRNVDASLFQVHRSLLCYSHEKSAVKDAETILRAESNLDSAIIRDDASRLLDKIEEVLNKSQPSYQAVILADYDLGLYSLEFIIELSGLLKKKNMGDVPVIAYAGRTWRKFGHLQNCYVVSDYEEALGQLEANLDISISPENTKPEDPFKAEQFKMLAECSPDLSGMVLTHSCDIYCGYWHVRGSRIEGKSFFIKSNREPNKAPIGYRAIVAAWLALKLTKGRAFNSAFSYVSKAAKCSQLHLVGKMRDCEKNLCDDLRLELQDPLPRIPNELDFSTAKPDSGKTNDVGEDSHPSTVLVKIFICYSRKQKEQIKTMIHHLSNPGLKGICKVESDRDLRGGDDWRIKIRDMLSSSDLILLFISKDFTASTECNEEMKIVNDIVQDNKPLIVPIFYERLMDEYTESINRYNRVPSVEHDSIKEFAHEEVGLKKTAEEIIEIIRVIHRDKLKPVIPRPRTEAERVLKTLKKERVALTELAMNYYLNKADLITGLDFLYSNTKIPVLAKSEWIPDTPFPVSELDKRITLMKQCPSLKMHQNDALLNALLNEKSDALYDGDLYRLLNIDQHRFVFCAGKYFDFLRSGEYLGWELAQEYRKAKERTEKSDKAWTLPDRKDCKVADFRSRCTAFGTSTLVIIKREEDNHHFILNKRSGNLGETPGLLHVIPAGTFQPAFNNGQYEKQYFSFTENIFREFVEEFIDDPDDFLRGNTESNLVFKDLLSYEASEFITHVKEKKRYSLWYLGTVVDPVNLKPEILTVLIIDERDVDLESWTPSWETESADDLFLKDFTKDEIQTVLKEKQLVPTGRIHLKLVHRHFDFLMKKIDEFPAHHIRL